MSLNCRFDKVILIEEIAFNSNLVLPSMVMSGCVGESSKKTSIGLCESKMTERFPRVCGQIGVIAIASTFGLMMGPPADKL